MPSDAFRRLAVAGWIVTLAALPAAAGAQVHFPPPPDHADYSRYAVPEACLAAVGRVVDSVQWRGRPDTIPYDAHSPLPEVAVATAKRCMAPFSVARVDTISLPAMRDLALDANDDSTSARAVARQYAGARTASDSVRAAILMGAVRSALDARPVRIEAATRYAAQMDALGPRVSLFRYQAHAQIVSALVNDLKDVGRVLVEANALTTLIQHVPPDIRAANPDVWRQGELLMRYALVFMTELRDGPAAGLAELKARGWDAGTMLGKRAPAIEATQWFNRADDAPRPRAGRISLVVFADPFCGALCFPFYATLRRVARANPDVEITIVAQTRGFFGGLLPASPAEEGELVGKYLLDYHQLPGALAVDSTPHSQMPAPDDRRLNQMARNNVAYGLSQAGLQMASIYPGDPLDVFVIGPDGIIDFLGDTSPTQERLLNAEIDAIRRTAASSSR